MPALHSRAFALAASLLLAACAGAGRQPPGPPPSTAPSAMAGIAFVGMALDEAEPGATRVRDMIAGPATVAGLRIGDRILRIDAAEVDARSAQRLFRDAAPGTRFTLEILRGDRRLTLELEVGERARWLGPAAYPSAVSWEAAGIVVPALAVEGDWPDPVIDSALADVPELQAIDARLDRMFDTLARDDSGFHKLPLVRLALGRPGAMSGWEAGLIDALRAPVRRDALVATMCATLALDCPPARGDDAPTQVATLDEFAATVAAANRRVREVFDAAGIDRAQAAEDLDYLLRTTARDRTLLYQPGVERGLRAMQLSMKPDLAALLAVLDTLLDNARRLPAMDGAAQAVPEALSARVQGDILGYAGIDGGFVVIGGPGPNRYDMSGLFAVIDVGGDDAYEWRDRPPAQTQTIIDLGGNDRYEAARGGPGAGWLGVALLIDRAGDDFYLSALGGCGAGVAGFGLLLDEAGADVYDCAAWSTGAGFYGAGVVIDEGIAGDVYQSQSFSQGVGGPRGFGLLLDRGGADLYRADGPVPSTYGTPGAFMSFSQGVGVGIRPYDTGGVGALLDMGGDDRYQAGEFSQGGGYFWGVGLLHDAAGNDLYFGNRYAQGFAAHQSFGLLTDGAGDDLYWSTTAAGQGAAWDQSIARLVDLAGNDVYRAQSLSQGAAAQQSRASLHDLGGDDDYRATTDIVQGVAGDNAYHFDPADPIYSLGVLVDESGDDRYSTLLQDGETRLRAPGAGVANGRGIAGVAIDRR